MSSSQDTAVTFELGAYTSGWTKARVIVPTAEDAQAIAAQFPKSAKVRASSISGYFKGDTTEGAYSSDPDAALATHGYVHIEIVLQSNGVNGGVNETGIKRYRAFRKHCARLGFIVEYKADGSNSYPTEADFEASLEA